MILPPVLNNALSPEQFISYFEPVDSAEFSTSIEEIVMKTTVDDIEITSEVIQIITEALEDDLIAKEIIENVETNSSC